MWICQSKSIPPPAPLKISNITLERVSVFKLLGVWVQDNLKWNCQVSTIVSKANKRIYHLTVCRKANLPTDVGLTLFCSKIRPVLEYAAPIWRGLPKYLEDEIQHVQDRCLDIIGLPRNSLHSLALRREIFTQRELQRIIS